MTFQDFLSQYCESAAFHEAGHAVVAAVQRMPLRHRGIHIDAKGQGIAFYWYALPDGSRNVGPNVERERTIISTGAGLVAQRKFFPDCPADGALADTDLVIKLLDEMFSDSHELLAAKKRLWHTTRDLVDQHWLAIEGLARTLWSKPWTPRSLEKERDWSKEPLEKWMSGDEVVRVLNQFDIPAFIVDDSMGQYAPPPQAMGSGY